MARLRRTDCSVPGITRKRAGRGFAYYDDGVRIEDPEVITRIRGLGIPPAWNDVWICPYPNGHLQATGIDAAGRKQYRYHEAWRTRRDAEKFDDMTRFARALPALRERVEADLTATDELTRERVLACAVRLLDRGFFRIGTEEYAATNESYGLATIRKEHVTIDGEQMIFDYPAKSGQRRIQAVVDPLAKDIVCTLKRRRGGGPDLLAYKVGRQWYDVRSADINDYLKEATGDDFSAKDFRTWSATVLAAVALAVSGSAQGAKTSRKRAITRAIKETAR
jgi:DNA topoisomerase-1